MRMTVLASGSKGNSTVVASSETRILIDAGLSCRELLKRMAAAGEDPAALTAILVTHEHQDHVSGLATLARKLRIPVYFTEPTHRAWVRMVTPRSTMTYAEWLAKVQEEKAQRAAQIAMEQSSSSGISSKESSAPGILSDVTSSIAAVADPDEDEAEPETAKPEPGYLPSVEYFASGAPFTIGDIAVTPFTIPHDAADPCGFVFESLSEHVRMAVATDLGYVPPNVKAALRRIDVLLLESNHDLEMLRDGPYPWSVKQRVLSRVGHLSNHAAAEFLARDYDGGAAYIVLGHLSEHNNVPELAQLAAEQALGNRMSLLGNRILLARQEAPLAPICL
ncbi:MAG TPA: MBL fold metallo-hydrolase [Acidobacteriaceae bacterium]|nr:MBL fold metallo-hydrolase [Acidobacteriaceae bacterium]